MTNILDIPLEVLAKIFCLFDVTDARSYRLVCTKFATASKKDILGWNDFYVNIRAWKCILKIDDNFKKVVTPETLVQTSSLWLGQPTLVNILKQKSLYFMKQVLHLSPEFFRIYTRNFATIIDDEMIEIALRRDFYNIAEIQNPTETHVKLVLYDWAEARICADDHGLGLSCKNPLSYMKNPSDELIAHAINVHPYYLANYIGNIPLVVWLDAISKYRDIFIKLQHRTSHLTNDEYVQLALAYRRA